MEEEETTKVEGVTGEKRRSFVFHIFYYNLQYNNNRHLVIKQLVLNYKL